MSRVNLSPSSEAALKRSIEGIVFELRHDGLSRSQCKAEFDKINIAAMRASDPGLNICFYHDIMREARSEIQRQYSALEDFSKDEAAS